MKMAKLILCLICFLANGLLSRQSVIKNHAEAPLDCYECHSCTKPTYKNPCLKLFPEFRRAALVLRRPATNVKAIVKIDTLSRLYQASIFKHKLHAEMSAFSEGGCASCHHNNPSGEMVPCIECHEPAIQRENLEIIGLKGAYHGQCLNCHRSWSHENDCRKCHLEIAENVPESPPGLTDMSHFKEEILPKKIYETDEDRPIVTFYHDAHSDVYGMKCIDCHQNESCTRCHDTTTAAAIEIEPHENCQTCHECDADSDKVCEKCHDTKERPPFDHAATGWPLKNYHAGARCLDCHSGKQFVKQDKQCQACHENFPGPKFDHRITGVVFDENHADNDCEDCHLENNFSNPPDCSGCHDEISFPESVPGKLTGKVR